MTDYPFNLFKTKSIINKRKIDSTYDIFSELSRTKAKESILHVYENEIRSYLKHHRMYPINFRLDDLNRIYEQILINNRNIEEFIKILIKNKNICEEMKTNLTTYLLTSYKFNDNIVYTNPIDFNYITLSEKNILDSLIRNSLLNNENNVKINFDILLLGKYLNLTMPSCGLVTTIVSSNRNNTFLKMIQRIVNETDEEYNIAKDIPFKSLNISKTLSSILLDVNINNLSSELINIIDKIEITLDVIYYKRRSNNNNNNDKKDIILKYLLPYKIVNDKNKDELKFKLMKKSDIRVKDVKNLIEHNNLLLKIVINNTLALKRSDIEKCRKNLEKKYYKDILFGYLFNIINIVYDICDYYLKTVDSHLTNMSIINKKKTGLLNLEEAFKYTSLLKKSLNKFRLILLNNLYNLFLPSKITNKLYGMKRSELGFYVKESKCVYVANNDNILEKYPFQQVSDDLLLNDEESHKNLVELCLNISSNRDLYDNTEKLAFGGLCFNRDVTESSLKIINNYFRILEDVNLYNLFIINKIIDFFKIHSSIPIELLSDLESNKNNLMRITYTNSFSRGFFMKFKNKYENSIKKVTKYLIDNDIIKKKIILLEQRNNNDEKTVIKKLYTQSELCQTLYKIYFLIANFILNLVQKMTRDAKFKNSLLEEFSKIKLNYEIEFQKHMNKNK
jgi:hypothetical protein